MCEVRMSSLAGHLILGPLSLVPKIRWPAPAASSSQTLSVLCADRPAGRESTLKFTDTPRAQPPRCQPFSSATPRLSCLVAPSNAANTACPPESCRFLSWLCIPDSFCLISLVYFFCRAFPSCSRLCGKTSDLCYCLFTYSFSEKAVVPDRQMPVVITSY